MKLSISDIAWSAEQDEAMYGFLRDGGFCGLEIAPTRIFPQSPYDRLPETRRFSEKLREEYHLTVSSVQSIWYGRKERIFGTSQERAALLAYTKKAIDFAEAAGCGNLVFGCPKNRIFEPGSDRAAAVAFFRELGDYAFEKNTVLSMEANPVLYGTNFINTTPQAFELVKEVGCAGFRVNVDLGTILYNGEGLDPVRQNMDLVNHIHVSEPGLAAIRERRLHAELADILKSVGYENFVSVEMKNTGDLSAVREAAEYIRGVFL